MNAPDILTTWSWFAGVPWFAAAVGVLVGLRVKNCVTTLATGVAVAAAGVFAGPLACAAALAAVVWWHRRSWKPAAAAAIAAPAAGYGAHMWATNRAGTDAEPPPLTSTEATFMVAAVVVALAAYLIAKRLLRPALDPQRKFTTAQRAQITRRDGNRCGYCGVPGDSPGVQIAVDHVVPWSTGGRTDVSNGRLACTPCNSRKGAKTWADFSRAFKKQHGYKPGEFDTPGFFDRLMR